MPSLQIQMCVPRQARDEDGWGTASKAWAIFNLPSSRACRGTQDRFAASLFTSRQSAKRGEVAAHKRFFFGSAPVLNLSFGGNGIGNAVEFLVKDKLHGTASCRVAAKETRIVLPHAV